MANLCPGNMDDKKAARREAAIRAIAAANQQACDRACALLMSEEGMTKAEADRCVELVFARIAALCQSMKPYIQGVIRWYVDGYLDVNDDSSCAKVNAILTVLRNSPILDEINKEFYEELTNKFLTPDDLKALLRLDDGVDVEPFTFNAADYEVVRIRSWHEMLFYKPLCADWCIMSSEEAWIAEACPEPNKVFVALHKDCKSTPRVPGPYFPYDKYGYSIICIILDASGAIVSTTSRWNGSIECDEFLSPAQVSSFINK